MGKSVKAVIDDDEIKTDSRGPSSLCKLPSRPSDQRGYGSRGINASRDLESNSTKPDLPDQPEEKPADASKFSGPGRGNGRGNGRGCGAAGMRTTRRFANIAPSSADVQVIFHQILQILIILSY